MASALALAALSVVGTVVGPTRQAAEELHALWSVHRGLRLHPQSLVARGAQAARALVAATGWMQVSCWRASFVWRKAPGTCEKLPDRPRASQRAIEVFPDASRTFQKKASRRFPEAQSPKFAKTSPSPKGGSLPKNSR